jgi:hypothetical protein
MSWEKPLQRDSGGILGMYARAAIMKNRCQREVEQIKSWIPEDADRTVKSGGTPVL